MSYPFHNQIFTQTGQTLNNLVSSSLNQGVTVPVNTGTIRINPGETQCTPGLRHDYLNPARNAAYGQQQPPHRNVQTAWVQNQIMPQALDPDRGIIRNPDTNYSGLTHFPEATYHTPVEEPSTTASLGLPSFITSPSHFGPPSIIPQQSGIQTGNTGPANSFTSILELDSVLTRQDKISVQNMFRECAATACSELQTRLAQDLAKHSESKLPYQIAISQLKEISTLIEDQIEQYKTLVKEQTAGLEKIGKAFVDLKNSLSQDIKKVYQSATNDFHHIVKSGNEKIQESATNFKTNATATEGRLKTILASFDEYQKKQTTYLEELNKIFPVQKTSWEIQTPLEIEPSSQASGLITSDSAPSLNTTGANSDTTSEPPRKRARKPFKDRDTKTTPKAETKALPKSTELELQKINNKTNEIITLEKSVTAALNILPGTKLPALRIIKAANALISHGTHKEIIAPFITSKSKRHKSNRKNTRVHGLIRTAFNELKKTIQKHYTQQSEEALPENPLDLLKTAASILDKQNSRSKYLCTRSTGPKVNLGEFLKNVKYYGFDKPLSPEALKGEKAKFDCINAGRRIEHTVPQMGPIKCEPERVLSQNN